MKNTLIERNGAGATPALGAHHERYQIFRQARAGNFMPEFKTDSATEAVEMFTIMTPAFEGGAIRLWDHSAQHVSASVEWRPERTDFGFFVYHRTNLFHDPVLGFISRHLQEREAMRETIRHETGISLAV